MKLLCNHDQNYLQVTGGVGGINCLRDTYFWYFEPYTVEIETSLLYSVWVKFTGALPYPQNVIQAIIPLTWNIILTSQFLLVREEEALIICEEVSLSYLRFSYINADGVQIHQSRWHNFENKIPPRIISQNSGSTHKGATSQKKTVEKSQSILKVYPTGVRHPPYC